MAFLYTQFKHVVISVRGQVQKTIFTAVRFLLRFMKFRICDCRRSFNSFKNWHDCLYKCQHGVNGLECAFFISAYVRKHVPTN